MVICVILLQNCYPLSTETIILLCTHVSDHGTTQIVLQTTANGTFTIVVVVTAVIIGSLHYKTPKIKQNQSTRIFSLDVLCILPSCELIDAPDFVLSVQSPPWRAVRSSGTRSLCLNPSCNAAIYHAHKPTGFQKSALIAAPPHPPKKQRK